MFVSSGRKINCHTSVVKMINKVGDPATLRWRRRDVIVENKITIPVCQIFFSANNSPINYLLDFNMFYVGTAPCPSADYSR